MKELRDVGQEAQERTAWVESLDYLREWIKSEGEGVDGEAIEFFAGEILVVREAAANASAESWREDAGAAMERAEAEAHNFLYQGDWNYSKRLDYFEAEEASEDDDSDLEWRSLEAREAHRKAWQAERDADRDALRLIESGVEESADFWKRLAESRGQGNHSFRVNVAFGAVLRGSLWRAVTSMEAALPVRNPHPIPAFIRKWKEAAAVGGP